MERNTALSAAPANINVSGSDLAPTTFAATNTIAAAMSAPISAITPVAVTLVNPHHVNPITTARAAPTLMPKSPGSANGLRVCPCISASATAKAEPTVTARIVRGSGHEAHCTGRFLEIKPACCTLSLWTSAPFFSGAEFSSRTCKSTLL